MLCNVARCEPVNAVFCIDLFLLAGLNIYIPPPPPNACAPYPQSLYPFPGSSSKRSSSTNLTDPMYNMYESLLRIQET